MGLFNHPQMTCNPPLSGKGHLMFIANHPCIFIFKNVSKASFQKFGYSDIQLLLIIQLVFLQSCHDQVVVFPHNQYHLQCPFSVGPSSCPLLSCPIESCWFGSLEPARFLLSPSSVSCTFPWLAGALSPDLCLLAGTTF